MKIFTIITLTLGFIISITTVNESWSSPFYKIKAPEYYYNLQYGYSGSNETIAKWTKDNSYFLTLNLQDYSEEKLYQDYLLNYKMEGDIRKMLSFVENKQIDKIDDLFADNMVRVLNILHKSEKGYLPNEEQFINYFIQKKPEILKYLYFKTLRKSRELRYPINKETGNVLANKWEEPFYMHGREPYDLYLENRTYSDYYYDYRSYFIFGILIFVGIFLGLLLKIFNKIHHNKKGGEKSDRKLEDSNKIDSWSELSKGEKVLLYILALIIPPLLIGLLSIPFFEEPIIIKNPWIDSVLFYGLIKLYFTRKYNHIITAGLIIILVWHVLINILIFNQL